MLKKLSQKIIILLTVYLWEGARTTRAYGQIDRQTDRHTHTHTHKHIQLECQSEKTPANKQLYTFMIL